MKEFNFAIDNSLEAQYWHSDSISTIEKKKRILDCMDKRVWIKEYGKKSIKTSLDTKSRCLILFISI